MDHVEMKEVVMVATMGGVKLITKKIPDTDMFEQGDAFNWLFSVEIPSIAPSGSYELSFTFNDIDGKAVACAATKAKL